MHKQSGGTIKVKHNKNIKQIGGLIRYVDSSPLCRSKVDFGSWLSKCQCNQALKRLFHSSREEGSIDWMTNTGYYVPKNDIMIFCLAVYISPLVL